MASPTNRRQNRFLATSAGTNIDAFTVGDWSLLSAIVLIWGTSFVLIDIGLDAFAPAIVAWCRIALGAAALACVPRARRTIFAREDLPRTLLIGVTWIGIPLLLFPIAQQWIASSVAGMINGGMPLMTALWAAIMLRRGPSRPQLAGLVIGFAGIVAIFLPEAPFAAAGSDLRSLLGSGLVVLAIFLYGFSANIAVPLQQRYGSVPLMLRMQLTGLAVVTPFAIAGLAESTFAWPSALAMIPLGMLSTGLAFVLMATLVGRVGGPRGSVAIYFVPIVAIVIGVVARGESVHPLAIVGTALVILGAFITSRREIPRPDLRTP
ncbi:MAG: DMT family transporter [Nitriliruptoraceae bacterium]